MQVITIGLHENSYILFYFLQKSIGRRGLGEPVRTCIDCTFNMLLQVLIVGQKNWRDLYHMMNKKAWKVLTELKSRPTSSSFIENRNKRTLILTIQFPPTNWIHLATKWQCWLLNLFKLTNWWSICGIKIIIILLLLTVLLKIKLISRQSWN